MPTFLDTLAAIVLTYAAHSAAACGLALGIARFMRRPHDRDVLWKAALVAPIFTAAGATLAGSLGFRNLIDLAELLRRRTSLPLPPRRVTIHVTNGRFAENVVRQFSDPLTAGLTRTAVLIAVVSVVVALVRFSIRRRALATALRRKEYVADIESTRGSTIRLFTTNGLQSPVAFGATDICLPAEVLAEFTDGHKQSLIAHETAHLERRDPPWFFAVELITAFSAFQPLVFIVARAFRRDVELICDEAAVMRTGDRGAMIGALARLAAPFDTNVPLHAATAYDGSPLVQRAERIAMLASDGVSRRSVRWILAAAVVAALPLAIPALASAPRLAAFPSDLTDLAREARASGRGMKVDSASFGAERIVRTAIVRMR